MSGEEWKGSAEIPRSEEDSVSGAQRVNSRHVVKDPKQRAREEKNARRG